MARMNIAVHHTLPISHTNTIMNIARDDLPATLPSSAECAASIPQGIAARRCMVSQCWTQVASDSYGRWECCMRTCMAGQKAAWCPKGCDWHELCTWIHPCWSQLTHECCVVMNLAKAFAAALQANTSLSQVGIMIGKLEHCYNTLAFLVLFLHLNTNSFNCLIINVIFCCQCLWLPKASLSTSLIYIITLHPLIELASCCDCDERKTNRNVLHWEIVGNIVGIVMYAQRMHYSIDIPCLLIHSCNDSHCPDHICPTSPAAYICCLSWPWGSLI